MSHWEWSWCPLSWVDLGTRQLEANGSECLGPCATGSPSPLLGGVGFACRVSFCSMYESEFHLAVLHHLSLKRRKKNAHFGVIKFFDNPLSYWWIVSFSGL